MIDYELLLSSFPLDKLDDNTKVKILSGLMLAGASDDEIIDGIKANGTPVSQQVLADATKEHDKRTPRALERILEQFDPDKFKQYENLKEKRKQDFDKIQLWRDSSGTIYSKPRGFKEFTRQSSMKIENHISYNYGFSKKKEDKNDELSPAEELLEWVRVNHVIKIAFENGAAGLKTGIYNASGKKVLICRENNPPKPVKGDATLIRDCFDKFFGPEQVEYFYGWLKDYVSCLRSGQRTGALILTICGEANIGKTFIIKIIDWLTNGGVTSGAGYLIEDNSFNGEWVDSSTIVLDDVSLGNRVSKEQFTSKIKECFFGSAVRIHGKGKDAVNLPLVQRLIIGANTDGESFKIIPSLDISFDDKMLLLEGHAGAIPHLGEGENWTNEERNARFKKQVPAFLYWLENEYVVPEKIRSHDRTFIKAFKNPKLLEIYEENSWTNYFAGYLRMVAPFKELNAKDIYARMMEHGDVDTEYLKDITRGFSPKIFSNMFDRIEKNKYYSGRYNFSLLKKNKNREGTFVYSVMVDGKNIEPSFIDKLLEEEDD